VFHIILLAKHEPKQITLANGLQLWLHGLCAFNGSKNQ